MTTEEIRATLTICLLAAWADGDKHAREHAQLREVAERLTGHPQINLPHLYDEVQQRRVPLPAVLQTLRTPEARQLAYEMAVCMCEADGHTSAPEQAFLAQLRQAWAMGEGASAVASATNPKVSPAAAYAAAAAQFTTHADTVAQAPLAGAWAQVQGLNDQEPIPHPTVVDQPSPPAAVQRTSVLSPAELDRKILQAAILHGAMELLPQNLSTLAIIPLQMRLVYQIGQSYGYELDPGHIKDLLAALGVGLTAQYLEEAGRKLLSGWLGQAGRGMWASMGQQAISSGMSFASTYALGHVAEQYYRGGRQLTTEMLQKAYQHIMRDSRQLQTRYLPHIQETARGLNLTKILHAVRGG